MGNLETLYKKSQATYKKHIEELERLEQEQLEKQRQETATEHELIRKTLVPYIGSLVEFLDLENVRLNSFSDVNYNTRDRGHYITIKLPNITPIRMNLYYIDEKLIITSVRERDGRQAEYDDLIFEVPDRARVDDRVSDPFIVWRYGTSFSDLYTAIGCALERVALEKDAWTQCEYRLAIKTAVSEPEPTWKDKLADAIMAAVEEVLDERY